MSDEKIKFLQEQLFTLLQPLKIQSKPRWGKMNAQQMVEHLIDFFDVSTGKLLYDLVTPEDQLSKYKAFLYSDKEFRENTKAPATVMGEEPQPVKSASIDDAKEKLRSAVMDFFESFKNNPAQTTIHPAFGPLNAKEWVLLHYKHVRHHYRQFGLVE